MLTIQPVSTQADRAKDLILLGAKYQHGKGQPADEEKAIICYKEAAKDVRNGPAACALLASIFRQRGDHRHAFESEKSGARLGHWDSLATVVNAYVRGEIRSSRYIAYSHKDKTPISDSLPEAYSWLRLGEEKKCLSGDKAAALASMMSLFQLAKARWKHKVLRSEYLANCELRERRSASKKEETNMFGFSKKKKPVTALDQFIFAIYGNPPPPKRANLANATRLAFQELLMGTVSEREVGAMAAELNAGPVPYSTQDLALSIALNFFKRPEYMQQLKTAQMFARIKMLQWLDEELVAPLLVKSFEDVLYKLYKP